jgi:acyl-CoA dehydrogenase
MLEVAEPEFMAEDDLPIFANSVTQFLQREAPPERVQKWRNDGIVERDFWTKAGKQGLLGVSVPEEYGGAGGDFRHDVIVIDQVARRDVSGFAISLHNGVVTPYVVAHGTEEQKYRWLPRLSNGELIAAVAMSAECRLGPLEDADNGAPRRQRVSHQRAKVGR